MDSCVVQMLCLLKLYRLLDITLDLLTRHNIIFETCDDMPCWLFNFVLYLNWSISKSRVLNTEYFGGVHVYIKGLQRTRK